MGYRRRVLDRTLTSSKTTMTILMSKLSRVSRTHICCSHKFPISQASPSLSTMVTTSSSSSPTYISSGGKRLLRCAAVTLGTLSTTSLAFVAHPPSSLSLVKSTPVSVGNLPMPCSSVANYRQLPSQRVLYHHHPHHHQSTRLFFSQHNKDEDVEAFKKSVVNLARKGIDKLKGILPFGKSEEEKRDAMLKKERKQEITGGIQSMLKDMPLPIRMAGRMIAPLLGNMANQIAEQSKQAQDMLEEARMRMANDAALTQTLGEPLQVGQPFSQSSSTTVINGKSSARMRASFQVAGPRGSGIATMESYDGEISTLVVNVNGRNLEVGSSRVGGYGAVGGLVYGKSSSSSAASRKKNDNIIEAEIIEKK